MKKFIIKIRKKIKKYFYQPKKENTIIYICDRRACKQCNAECMHTTDIKHAKNFVKLPTGAYWEE